MKIKIYHRPALHEVDDPKLVYEFETKGNDTMPLEEVFLLFNSYPYEKGMDDEPDVLRPDHPYYAQVVEYRSRHLRSLSVGDQVQIEDVLFAVLPIGWKTIQP